MTLLQPSVGLPDFWAGSGFEDKLLQAQGDFSLNAGQHSVTYLPNDEIIAADCPSHLRDGSRKVYLPRVQVRAVGPRLGLTNGV